MTYWKQLNSAFALLLLGSIVLNSCSQNTQFNGEDPLARAYNQYLYPSDLVMVIPLGLNKTDSAKFVSNYINQWINRQLLVKQAAFNLDPEKNDFTQLVEDYRASLVIHAYQKQLLSQKTDTIITQAEVESYFNKNLAEFQLSVPIVKALYIRINKNNSKVNEIKSLIRSSNDRDFENLVDLCYQYADKFDFFDDHWVSFNRIMQNIPGSPEDHSAFLRSENLMEVEDQDFLHLLQIHDYKLAEETAPISYVNSRIRDMIMTERRQFLLDDLEQSVYREAAEKNEFEIFQEK